MSSIFIRGKDTLWSRFVELRQRRREWDKRRRRVRRKSRIKHKILLVNLKTVSMSWRETRRRVKVCLGWKKYTQFQWEWLDSHCFPTCSSCCDLRYNNRKFNWGGEDFIFYYFNLHFTYLFSFSTFSGIFHSFYIISSDSKQAEKTTNFVVYRRCSARILYLCIRSWPWMNSNQNNVECVNRKTRKNILNLAQARDIKSLRIQFRFLFCAFLFIQRTIEWNRNWFNKLCNGPEFAVSFTRCWWFHKTYKIYSIYLQQRVSNRYEIFDMWIRILCHVNTRKIMR